MEPSLIICFAIIEDEANQYSWVIFAPKFVFSGYGIFLGMEF